MSITWSTLPASVREALAAVNLGPGSLVYFRTNTPIDRTQLAQEFAQLLATGATAGSAVTKLAQARRVDRKTVQRHLRVAGVYGGAR